MGTWFYGQWDYLWPWLDAGRRVGAQYPEKLSAALDAHCTITKSIGWWYPFNDFCIVTDRPSSIVRDDNGRLHTNGEPSLAYRDGYELYASHGVRIPAELAQDRSKITIARIGAETNAEVRRVLVEWYGMARYIKDSGARVVHQDKDQLGNERRLLWRDQSGDEPIVVVEVTDSTPQPDGTSKKYTLRIDPNMYDGRAGRECHAAVASTWRHKSDKRKPFFDRPESYAPKIET